MVKYLYALTLTFLLFIYLSDSKAASFLEKFGQSHEP